MKVKELSSILNNLDPDLEVKMYLYTPAGFKFEPGIEGPMRVDPFNICDVLISTISNSVLLSSKLNS